jgi:D-arabinan exo alpha-(1,3)/(1,5)-arabinofuranosidase (non-reducing end)
MRAEVWRKLMLQPSGSLRRGFLKRLLGLVGATVLADVPASAATKRTPAPPEAAQLADAADRAPLPTYARVLDYRSLRQSSYDRSGANHDAWFIETGATSEIFSSKGPGVITHIWFTMAPLSSSFDVLKQIVLRMYWEGNPKPSVEAPIGDFFGLNLAEYFIYESAFLNCSPEKGLNCYFAMPFRHSARITITNESDHAVRLFFFNIDYQLLPSLPDDAVYFHAQYRQARPNKAVNLPNGSNKDGKYNYVFLETRGRGHLMGVTLGVLRTADGWWGEGDDMIFIDDEDHPAINGTGAEDYFNGGWGFGSKPFANLYNGEPYVISDRRAGARACVYRWHADNPIAFTRYLKHTLEHGTADDRADCYYSVAYWYQTEPYTDFPALPPVLERSTEPILT